MSLDDRIRKAERSGDIETANRLKRKAGGTIRVSASQIKTFDEDQGGCQRKWGLEKVLKWPGRKKTASTTLGSVLHAVAERYLLADDLGRDEQGNPVDLYPEGWKQDRNPWTNDLEGEVTEAQATVIQALIKAAIQQKILERRRHRRVEQEVNLQVCEGVSLIGFIDLAIYDPELPEIQDHKTSKATRWLKSPAKLAEDDQMLIYAYAVLEELGKIGRSRPDKVLLRHNQFVTDPNNMVVRKTQTTVTSDHVDAHWHTKILPIAREMKQVKDEIKSLGDTASWHSFKQPDNDDPCFAFGGCPYQGVCYGRETENEFKARWALANRQEATEVVCMSSSIKDKLAARRAKRAGTKAPVISSDGYEGETPAGLSEAPPAPAPKSDKPRVPWHAEGCRACQDNQILGLSTTGKPCRICLVKGKGNLPSPGDYEIYFQDGQVYWDDGMDVESAPWVGEIAIQVKEGKPLPEVDLEAPAAPAEEEAPPAPKLTKTPESAPPPTMETKDKPKAPAPKVQERDKSTTSLAQHVATTLGTERLLAIGDAVDRAMGKGQRGRKKHKLKLMVNCLPEIMTSDKVYHLGTILRELVQQVEHEKGTPFQMLDTWQRRDQIVLAVPVIAEKLAGNWIVCSTGSPLERAVTEALKQHATVIVTGTK